ncbi:putative Dol-P-Man:Man(7)GlcNAc(2)-PP-Dol alpha-1,6-mannosyltransferase [Halotydeus destructor]|nr:putative Dol-P-Man:Man(7)GlcNAc(2)-PP-Dol alpha-1,6-mannosyltransferase [Halotydeus destructor]
MGSLISILVMSSSIQFTALTVVSVIFVLLTPFTKVEESFNIQATHDFLYIGFPRAYSLAYSKWHDWIVETNEDDVLKSIVSALRINQVPLPEPVGNLNFTRWDHEDFPGPVGRSFIGPFVLALLTLPWSFVPHWGEDKFYVQVIARINLALLVIAGFNSFANAIGRKYGSTTRRALIVLTLTQFHFVYYLSRPLPNTFALGLTLLAMSNWILRKMDAFIFLTAITVVIFRAETCLLYGWILFYELIITRDLTVWRVLRTGIPSGLLAMAVTVLFDSWIWGRWVWPEGDGLYFNVFLNKSHEWGTKPFFWYLYSALPRALLLSLVFVPFATKKCMKNMLAVSMLFVLTYSMLPHKELRFIMYIIPMLNVCAANTVAIMVEKFEGSKPCPESWLGNFILKKLGQEVPTDEESEAADRERDEKEREEEDAKRKRKDKQVPPAQYDAITPSSSGLRRRGKGMLRNGSVEQQLDEQYSKITAAVLEKHRSPAEVKRSTSGEGDEEPASLSCTFIIIFILMGIHIWCNVGCTVYASLASWNNYPGGDALFWLNHHIRTNEVKESKLKPADIGIYVSNLAAQTGVTRFMQIDGITYDKSPSFDLVANKTNMAAAYAGKKAANKNTVGRHITHDFSVFRVTFPILEKVDVPFLQLYCTSASASSSSGKGSSNSKKSAATSGIENVICNFGENTKNCKIMKVVNGFNGIDLGLTSKNVVIKTTPMLWIFKCVKSLEHRY